MMDTHGISTPDQVFIQFQPRPFFGALALSLFVTGNAGLIATHLNLQVSLPVYGLIFCGLASSIYFFALRLAHDRVAGLMTRPRPIDALFDPE